MIRYNENINQFGLIVHLHCSLLLFSLTYFVIIKFSLENRHLNMINFVLNKIWCELFWIMVSGVDSELFVLKTCESPPLSPIEFVCNSTEKEEHIGFNDILVWERQTLFNNTFHFVINVFFLCFNEWLSWSLLHCAHVRKIYYVALHMN